MLIFYFMHLCFFIFHIFPYTYIVAKCQVTSMISFGIATFAQSSYQDYSIFSLVHILCQKVSHVLHSLLLIYSHILTGLLHTQSWHSNVFFIAVCYHTFGCDTVRYNLLHQRSQTIELPYFFAYMSTFYNLTSNQQ